MRDDRPKGEEAKPKAVPAEACVVLSITELIRQKQLIPGAPSAGFLLLSGPTPPLVIIDYEADLTDPTQSCLLLHYRVGRQKVGLLVYLATTRPTYGGLRWWFVCPLQGHAPPEGSDRPGHRATKLYLPPGESLFGSRKGHELTYRSCQQTADQRRLFRAASAMDGVDAERLTASLFGDKDPRRPR